MTELKQSSVRSTNLRDQGRGCSGSQANLPRVTEATMIECSGFAAATHPALQRSGLVAGIGLRGQATCSQVLDLLDICLAGAGLGRQDLVALATVDRRSAHPALAHAASVLGVQLLSVPMAHLPLDVPNPSQRVSARLGCPSVAEAAALCFGPLLLEKQRGDNVTCALAAYTPSSGASRSSAAIAPATLSTSSAGP